MSAFMVNSRTLAKIALYMARCGNYGRKSDIGLSGIELAEDFKKVLADKGCVKATGLFAAPLIFACLYERNRNALIARYGKTHVGEGLCPVEMERMPNGIACDTDPATRRTWLANLYTVCRCYLYQIEEGEFSDGFFCGFRSWIQQMAGALAAYVVDEVRSKTREQYKPWDEF